MKVLPLSKNHQKQICKLHQKKYRQKEGAFIAEGANAFESVAKMASSFIKEIVIDQEYIIKEELPKNIPIYACSKKEMKIISTEKTPQGILMVCRQKKSSLEMLMENSPDTLLYINGISDPGNLGTILRTAAWFGIKQILINHSCVDPYNTKTVRASAGTIFLVEIYQISERQLFQFAEEKEYKLIATVPHGGTAIDKWKKVGRNIVMFGHESKGLSEETINHADESISIPGHGNVESLNLAVATSIILYEIGKRSKHS